MRMQNYYTIKDFEKNESNRREVDEIAKQVQFLTIEVEKLKKIIRQKQNYEMGILKSELDVMHKIDQITPPHFSCSPPRPLVTHDRFC